MKVCLIAREYLPSKCLGGIGTYMRIVSRSLAKNGIETHVICLSNEKDMDFIEDGVHVHAIKDRIVKRKGKIIHSNALEKRNLIDNIKTVLLSNPLMEIMFLPVISWRILLLFRRLNKEYHFDIVEAEDGQGIGMLLPLVPRIRLITRLHTPSYLVSLLNYQKINMKRRAIKSMEGMQFRHSIALNANSQSMKKKVAETWNIPLSKIDVTYLGIDRQKCIELAKKKSPVKGDYLLYFGAFEERKGVGVFVDALPKIFERYPGMKMVFLGRNEYSGRRIKSMIKRRNHKHLKNILFLGKKGYSGVIPILNGARLVILTSPWEAFGYTCLESLTLGKIVIATKGSGFEEQIQKDGKAGFLIPANDPEILFKKVCDILEMDKASLERISKNAINRSKDFDNARITNNLINYYKSVMKR